MLLLSLYYHLYTANKQKSSLCCSAKTRSLGAPRGSHPRRERKPKARTAAPKLETETEIAQHQPRRNIRTGCVLPGVQRRGGDGRGTRAAHLVARSAWRAARVCWSKCCRCDLTPGLHGSGRDFSGPLSSCCGLWAALNSSFGRDRVARYHPMALRAEASLEQDAVWTDSCRHSPPRLHRAWPRGPDFQGLEHASA